MKLLFSKTLAIFMAGIMLAAVCCAALSACTNTAVEPETGTEGPTDAADTAEATENPIDTPTQPDADTRGDAPTGPDCPPDTDTVREPDTVYEPDTGEDVTAGDADTEDSTADDTDTEPGLTDPVVTVVSFNLDANANTVGKRAPGLIETVLSYDPDSFGVQECRGPWISQLKKGLGKTYGRVGVDAGGNENGSDAYFATYIYYKADKYNVVDSGTFWLSRTPDVPSQYGSTVDCNRTCVWVILEDKATGFRYVHINCHLDWMDSSVNKVQAGMIREHILRFEALGYPVFATGDYNTDEGSVSYREVLKRDEIGDSKYLAAESMDLGTYPSYGEYDVTKEKPIDFVFVTTGNTEVLSYRVMNDEPNGIAVSDHYGLCVKAALKNPVTADTVIIPDPPVFTGDITYDGDSVTTRNLSVEFACATDVMGNAAEIYRVTLTDPTGQTVISDTVNGGMFLIKPLPTYEYSATGLEPDTEYTVTVTPVSLFGLEGEPVSVKVKTAKKAEFSGEIPQPDMFDLDLSSGKPLDKSAANMTVTDMQTTEVSGGTLVFKGNSNLKITGIADRYADIADGFTHLISFNAQDVTTEVGLFANLHAGGFGFYLESGYLIYYLHSGGSYVTLKYAVKANQDYTAVVVWDTVNVRMYVNGVPVASAKANGKFGIPTVAGAQYLCLGADSDATGKGEYPVKAKVYAAKLWSVPLDDEAVPALFE